MIIGLQLQLLLSIWGLKIPADPQKSWIMLSLVCVSLWMPLDLALRSCHKRPLETLPAHLTLIAVSGSLNSGSNAGKKRKNDMKSIQLMFELKFNTKAINGPFKQAVQKYLVYRGVELNWLFSSAVLEYRTEGSACTSVRPSVRE